MSRYFNEREVELLAPAGNFEIFKEVIYSGADAVYIGGKSFNMRMHRKDFNFTDDEIKKALEIAHTLNKKVYITINNMLNESEIEEVVKYLKFLEYISVDGIIVQDMGIIALVKQNNINLEIHSSVMMNVHNYDTITALRKLGVTRVVTSRDIDLKTIKTFSVRTDMEFEYFIHGDMCVAHGGQCLYSGIIFGKSSNRGLCMKPCRWKYTIQNEDKKYNSTYPMAVKDMYMYENIPELIEAGVVSFKIEGRMRDSAYLIDLIDTYSDAIDRYIDDPIGYIRNKYADKLFQNRKRDFSTAYAFGNPGLDFINERYEGTGKFYSTGKVFSNPIDEFDITSTRINELKDILKVDEGNSLQLPKLAVKVNSYEGAMVALDENVDTIYLSGEVFLPNKPFTKDQIKKIVAAKNNTKVYLAFPKMVFDEEISKYNQYLRNGDLGIDGALVTNLGVLDRFKDLNIEFIGDYGLNIYNSVSAEFYKNHGLKYGTVSVEGTASNLKELLVKSNLPLEIIVHGSPTVMYMSLDLYENLNTLEWEGGNTYKYNKEGILLLVDDRGNEHPVYKDNYKINHMLLSKELCYLPILKELYELGARSFRIEGAHYDLNTLRDIIRIYKNTINNMELCNEQFEELNYDNLGFTFGSLQFN